ncbi:MAG TPA: hypothetical protein VGQ52_16625 [Gemmatimonadaceae bacterium]|jgi:hypothetical protein|nr:hypothetical protein [Gemmatimonadaceae bacterium]
MRFTRVVAGFLLLVACGDNPSRSVAPNAISDGAVNVVDDVSSQAWPSDPLTIESATIVADALQATVRFGGGCTRHRIALLLGRAFMESFPVQVHARLAHDAGGDMCDALLTRTLTFDLTPLKQRYRNAYGAGAATVVINLSSFPRSLRYAF